MPEQVSKLIYGDLSFQINGILYHVHNKLGPGLKENTYERAVAVGLDGASIPYQRQFHVPILFDGKKVGDQYFDFLVDGKIVLELKAGDYFDKNNIYQMLEYLRYSNLQLGLLANFTRGGVKIKRVVNLTGRDGSSVPSVSDS